eukprot:TRINITY_DN1054_c0_g5_i2.p3 TRINITY_DN1054_c0_g5~~TRINITY_DN1054_c0_g5_i2.p3  ORF type:complete len:117 (+),score=29.05 TRINITY_DN1054_c0_g5_i2:437-787(+)
MLRKQYDLMRQQYFSLTKHGKVFNRFHAQTEQIKSITRMGMESSDTSQAVVERMKAQTKTVVRTFDNVRQTDAQLRAGDKLINSMSWNDYCYKLGLHVLAFVLFVLIVLMIVYKLF